MRRDEYAIAGRQTVKIQRDAHGVPLIRAATWEDAWLGLGWVHGHDRGGQVGAMRLVASGRLCEVVVDNPLLVELDRYYRRLGFARHSRAFIETLDPGSRACVEAYCQGINQAWEERRPGILRLLGYWPEPFTAADVLAQIKLMSYAGLAEGQRMAELFVVEAVRRGVDEQRLHELFPTLDSLDPGMIRGLRAVPTLFPGERPLLHRPYGGGSNSWVVSGARAKGASPILCNDPHLPVDRLPAILYEAQLQVGTDWAHGGSVVGIPGILSGRNRFLAWGVVNACADSTDFFVERCQQGCYLREGEWLPFRQQREQILRKQHPPMECLVYENDHGILEGDPWEDGDYLCWGWSGLGAGGVGTLKALLNLAQCKGVVEAQQILHGAEIPSLNVVLADQAGNIGLQMIGFVPRRRQGWSGLAPVAGWLKANDWLGWLDPASEIPAFLNPEHGSIVVSNEARRHPNGPVIATVPQPPYRQQRILELLASKDKLDIQDMQAIHYDVVSIQARCLLPLFLPYVPEGPQRTMLEAWDLRYMPESEAATLFENIYQNVLLEVFGDGGLGREWIQRLLSKTLLFLFLFGFFDNVLCRGDSKWLPASQRDAVLSRAVRAGIERPLEVWGQRNTVTFQNIFLGGRLPRILGFDPGPYPLAGSRATVRLSDRIHQFGRDSICAPAYHFITDLAGGESWTNLPGGACESRFSRYYSNQLRYWLSGEYKELST